MRSRDAYHHGDLPAALVQAARELLAEGGDLSLREAARRAGVSNAAPYRHFDGLPALLDAVAAAVLEDLATDLEVAAAGHASAADALRALAAEYVRLVVERPGEARVAFGAPKRERPAGSATATAATRAFEVVVGVIARGQRSGEFGPGDPSDAALAGWALIHGLAGLMSAGQVEEPDGPTRARVIDRTVLVFLDGLRGRRVRTGSHDRP